MQVSAMPCIYLLKRTIWWLASTFTRETYNFDCLVITYVDVHVYNNNNIIINGRKAELTLDPYL